MGHVIYKHYFIELKKLNSVINFLEMSVCVVLSETIVTFL